MPKEEERKRKIVEKFFCPICGSAAIKPLEEGKFICENCGAIFSKPKKTKIELEETPRYIG